MLGSELKQNQKLVNYFVKHFYTSVDSTLEHIASISFKFVVDGGDSLDFHEYADRKELMREHIQISFDEPTSDDDIHFKTRFQLEVPRTDQLSISGAGEMLLRVERNLITEIIVNYDQTGQDNKSIQAAIAGIRKIEDSIKFV